MAKVLFMHDDQEVCDRFKADAEKKGHDVVTATSASDALSLFDEGGFDVVLAKRKMPWGMGGFDLTEAIRKENKEIPVVLMSTTPDEKMKLAFKEMGGTKVADVKFGDFSTLIAELDGIAKTGRAK